MALFKNLIVIAAVALAIGQNVEGSDETNEDICRRLAREMVNYGELRDNAMKAFDFARIYVEKNTGLLSSGRKLIKAWEGVAKGECSASSWEQFQLMYKCHVTYMGALDKPMKAYARKCLTPEYVSRKVKELTSSMFAKRVDMVDSQFLSEFGAHNPADPFRLITEGHISTVLDKFIDTATDAIKRDFAKRGKDPKEAFYANPGAVSNYMEKKLFKPCKVYMKNYNPILIQVRVIGKYLGSGPDTLIPSLDQEAREIVFRLKYCYQVEDATSFRNMVVKNVAKKFV